MKNCIKLNLLIALFISSVNIHASQQAKSCKQCITKTSYCELLGGLEVGFSFLRKAQNQQLQNRSLVYNNSFNAIRKTKSDVEGQPEMISVELGTSLGLLEEIGTVLLTNGTHIPLPELAQRGAKYLSLSDQIRKELVSEEELTSKDAASKS